jgi:hypothetical protein
MQVSCAAATQSFGAPQTNRPAGMPHQSRPDWLGNQARRRPSRQLIQRWTLRLDSNARLGLFRPGRFRCYSLCRSPTIITLFLRKEEPWNIEPCFMRARSPCWFCRASPGQLQKSSVRFITIHRPLCPACAYSSAQAPQQRCGAVSGGSANYRTTAIRSSPMTRPRIAGF